MSLESLARRIQAKIFVFRQNFLPVLRSFGSYLPQILFSKAGRQSMRVNIMAENSLPDMLRGRLCDHLLY